MSGIGVRLTWKQYLVGAAVGLIVAVSIFSVQYAFTIWPIYVRAAQNDMSREEIIAEIEELFDNRYKGSWTTSEITLDQYTLTWERRSDTACDVGGSYWYRLVTLDIRTLQTRPDRVRISFAEARENPRLGVIPERAMVTWYFTEDAAETGDRLADESRKLLTEWRDRIGWGEYAAHEATNVFLERFGDELRTNYRLVRYCTGNRSISPFRRDFFITVRPDDPGRLVELMHVYRSRFYPGE
jgi:hypothetical protein